MLSDYLSQPREVSIETYTLCNAACSFCPYPTLDRKGTFMDQALLDRLMSELCTFKHPFYFSPFKVNEPFLDARVLDICGRLTEAQPLAQLRLFTNGSTLTDERIARIAQLRNVAHLWVSLNSHEPDEYHRIMRLKFEQTARKLDALHMAYEHGSFPHPVVLSKVSARPLQEYLFTGYCKTRWPYFQTSIIKQDGWLGFVPPSDPAIPDTPCVRWFELSILSTGVVSLCCMDGKGEFSIGNVNENTLLEVYNNHLWRERREKLFSRRSVYPCSTCTY